MHDRNFLRDRVSSTCEPGLRHTREVDSHYWAAQGCPLGRIPTFPSASLLFYARRSYTSACTHDATKFSYASLLHYVVAYNRACTDQLRCPSTRVQPCATQVNPCCYVLSGFHSFSKRVVRGRRLSAQSR